MKRSNYAIFFGVLGLIVVGLLVFTLMQAKPAKQDAQTSKAINDMADKLNSYVTDNGIPDSLAQAGIKNVPSTISFTKTSNSEYIFCAKYNNASTSYGSGWPSIVNTAASSGSQTTTYPSYPTETLDSYMTYFHKKGKNCQTVQPTQFNSPIIQPLQNSTNNSPTTST